MSIFNNSRSSLVVASCVLAAVAHADHTRMVVLYNGAPVGENTFDESADGAFDSESTIALGSIKLGGFVKGHFKNGRVLDYTSESSNPGTKVSITYANGKLTGTVNGKSQTLPLDNKSGLYGGNIHPQLFTGTLLAAEKAIAANPAGKSTTLKAFFLDLGAELPLKIEELPAKAVTIDGHPQAVRRFRAALGPLSLELDMDDAGHVVAFDVPVQKLRFVVEGWNDALFEDPLEKFPELSQPTFKYKTEKVVKMKTRDGVDLACDVVRPEDGDKHPAILVRTPYGRGADTLNGPFYASRGYAYITQDCRGREDSGGEWDPFVHEGPDGYDAVQWVAQQPWCDGKVGMIGGSYEGLVQWAAAVKGPPALKCIVPEVSPPDAMRNVPYDHGVFALYLDLWWAKIVAGRTSDFSTLLSSLPHPRALTTLPLSNADTAVLGKHLPFYQKWLARSTIGEWQGWDYTYHLNEVTIPALHISGTWDGDEIGTHINWTTMRALGRKNQWIVFGPWTHAFNTTHSLGDLEYGPTAIIDLDSVALRWFDTWLKGKDVGLDKVAHVRLFVTGANKWVNLSDWPAPESRLRTLYFGKGTLMSEPPRASRQGYTYDPAKDIKIPQQILSMDPSKATTKVPLSSFPPGKALLLKSAPFKRATAVISPLSVKLYFATSAQNTDFYAMCLDIGPDGAAHVLGSSGKLRASYLQGMDKIRPLTPYKVYEATLTPWDFAHEFAPGHQLGLAILSSGFPIYSRNLGTVEPIATATRMVVQRNTILMGKHHPSSLSFYVLWEK